jgi:hypothetical protein
VSLDVDLTGETKDVPWTCAYCDHKHTRKETESFYSANITHNLGAMAEEAGIYKHLWRPEEIGITKAAQLIDPLRAGIALMKSDPPRFEKHNAVNGWGTYAGFVPWIEKYLAACEANPTADVSVSR